MKVSVIVPCFNQGHFLRACVDSVLRQANSNFELILVDDGSTDETALIAESYGNKITYIYQENHGLSSARNTGIGQATGDLLHFLDADDYISPYFYEKAVEVFIANPDAVVVYSGHIKIDINGSKISSHAAEPEPQEPYHYLLSENRWPCHAVIVQRRAVNAIGHFNVMLRSLEDWDMWLRIASQGGRFVPISDGYVYYRQYSSSMSKNREVMFWASLQVLSSQASSYHADCGQCNTLSAKTLRAVIAHYLLPEMTQYLKHANLFLWTRRLAQVFRPFPQAAFMYLSLLCSQLKRGLKIRDEYLIDK